MIALSHLSKTFHSRGRKIVIARDICLSFPARQTVGLLGRNGAGKSSLLRLIAGLSRPDHGQVLRRGTVSWPVGFQGSFHPDLSGAENAAFVARIYRLDPKALIRFADDFAELGEAMRQPLRHYSAGMRARLAFAISMAVSFDTYLVDEVTAVGDGAFRAKCEAYLADRLHHAGAIVVSHSVDHLRRLCQAGAVLEEGRLFYYQRIDRAIEHYEHLMSGRLPPWLR